MSFFKAVNNHRFTLHEFKSQKLLAKLVMLDEKTYGWVDPMEIRYELAIFDPDIFNRKDLVQFLAQTDCLAKYQEEKGIVPGTNLLIAVHSIGFPDAPPMWVKARHGNPPPVVYMQPFKTWSTSVYPTRDN